MSKVSGIKWHVPDPLYIALHFRKRLISFIKCSRMLFIVSAFSTKYVECACTGRHTIKMAADESKTKHRAARILQTKKFFKFRFLIYSILHELYLLLDFFFSLRDLTD